MRALSAAAAERVRASHPNVPLIVGSPLSPPAGCARAHGVGRRQSPATIAQHVAGDRTTSPPCSWRPRRSSSSPLTSTSVSASSAFSSPPLSTTPGELQQLPEADHVAADRDVAHRQSSSGRGGISRRRRSLRGFDPRGVETAAADDTRRRRPGSRGFGGRRRGSRSFRRPRRPTSSSRSPTSA